MKYILLPYRDEEFNTYILKYIKRELRSRSEFTVENNTIYEIDGKKYTSKDIIKSLILLGNKIYFSNNKLINYVVYDLSQRFWYDVLNTVNNKLSYLYLCYKGNNHVKFTTQR
jgi:hypothetical protein